MSQYEEVKKASFEPGAPFKNQKEITEHYNAFRDFQMFSTGQYINREDAEKQDVKLMVRYGGKSGVDKVFIVNQ